MRQCCIPGCDNEVSDRSRLRTCTNCRASLHQWEKRSAGEIVNRIHNLRKYRGRMDTFAIVKDDEVRKIPHKEIEAKRLAVFKPRKPRKKKKIPDNVLPFKKNGS